MDSFEEKNIKIDGGELLQLSHHETDQKHIFISMNTNVKENSLQIKIKKILLPSIAKDIILTEEDAAIKAEISQH